MRYCNVVVDISLDKLDKTFQYKIPEGLQDTLIEGMQVEAPFGRGNRVITGYVVTLSDEPEFDPFYCKSLFDCVAGGPCNLGDDGPVLSEQRIHESRFPGIYRTDNCYGYPFPQGVAIAE